MHKKSQGHPISGGPGLCTYVHHSKTVSAMDLRRIGLGLQIAPSQSLAKSDAIAPPSFPSNLSRFNAAQVRRQGGQLHTNMGRLVL